jgi:hypothetical protein
LGGDYIEGMKMCLPQVIKSFQSYRRVATTFYPTLVFGHVKENGVRMIAKIRSYWIVIENQILSQKLEKEDYNGEDMCKVWPEEEEL